MHRAEHSRSLEGVLRRLVPRRAETTDADAEEAETGRLGELEAKVRALEIANATLETENAALAGRLKEETERADDQGTTAMYLTAQKSELQDLVSEAVGALVEWNVPTKDVPDDDAPFYTCLTRHRAHNMRTFSEPLRRDTHDDRGRPPLDPQPEGAGDEEGARAAT